jgi:hypothetical protein
MGFLSQKWTKDFCSHKEKGTKILQSLRRLITASRKKEIKYALEFVIQYPQENKSGKNANTLNFQNIGLSEFLKIYVMHVYKALIRNL